MAHATHLNKAPLTTASLPTIRLLKHIYNSHEQLQQQDTDQTCNNIERIKHNHVQICKHKIIYQRWFFFILTVVRFALP